MVLSSKQRRARSKEAKERMNESATAIAELAANIETEVDGDAEESIDPTSVRDTPPPSDLEDIEEDSIDVEKFFNSRKSVKPIDDNSKRSTNNEINTDKDTAEKKGMKTLLIKRETKPPIYLPSKVTPTEVTSESLPTPKSQSHPSPNRYRYSTPFPASRMF